MIRSMTRQPGMSLSLFEVFNQEGHTIRSKSQLFHLSLNSTRFNQRFPGLSNDHAPDSSVSNDSSASCAMASMAMIVGRAGMAW